jgi:trans-aconitate 2-methyltransferase
MDGGIAAGWPDRRAGSLECLGAVAQDRSTGCRDRALRVGPEEYAGMLFELGYVEQHVRLQVYPHVLDCSRDVVEVGPRRDPDALPQVLEPKNFAEYLVAYEQALIDEIGDRRPYFFPVQRVLIWGRLG